MFVLILGFKLCNDDVLIKLVVFFFPSTFSFWLKIMEAGSK